jgi:hypothetical protein
MLATTCQGTTHLGLLRAGAHEQGAQQLARFDDVADACPALDISSASAARLLVSACTLPLLLQLLQDKAASQVVHHKLFCMWP